MLSHLIIVANWLIVNCLSNSQINFLLRKHVGKPPALQSITKYLNVTQLFYNTFKLGCSQHISQSKHFEKKKMFWNIIKTFLVPRLIE